METTDREKLLCALEQINREKAELESSPALLKGTTLINLADDLKHLRIGSIIRKTRIRLRDSRREKALANRGFPGPKGEASELSNYASDRPHIAVYTCITGGYDTVLQPAYVPDNCDFYLVTDAPPKEAGAYTVLSPYDYYTGRDKRPAMVNRFIKMHPHLMFGDYEYSIYIDGNIRAVSDLTGLVDRIGKTGIAASRHYRRSCVFDEGEACVILGKATARDMKEQLGHYRQNGMPERFGLYENGVIARRHNDPVCISLMSEWWEEYCRFDKRDQLSLPFVIWKNGYHYEDVGLICNDVRKDPKFSFREVHR